jgi:deoxycytidylate deaminase
MKFNLLEPNSEIRKVLEKATSRSTHSRYQTGCVIINKKGKVISDGCAHASSFRISKLHSIHAEIHAVARGRHTNLKDSIAFVQTNARKSGNMVNSKPCLACAIALQSVGISTAIFSQNSGEFELLDLEQDISHLKIYPERN